jgi:histidyl-tRNA synthetase
MKSVIKSVKGTRDFYPQEMGIRTWIYQKVRQVSEAFGYQEFEGPYLESIDLYAAKSGEELVKEQSFVFPDRGGDLISLRPELTPTLVRMVAKRQKQLVYPLRWWSFGPFWRYERPQKGRSREFFQWNIDLIGVNTPEADAEMVSIMANLFQLVRLSPSEVGIAVNNRRLIDIELSNIGITPNQIPNVYHLIDRKEKLEQKKWVEYGLQIGLEHDTIHKITSLLQDRELWKKSQELIRFFETIDILGMSDYVFFDPYVIRGLDYYTGTVYEGKSKTPDIRRSVSGGGRYDNLLADVGGDPLPGTGFAMGDMVITLLLEKYGLIPTTLADSPAAILVTVFDDDCLLNSYSLASKIRREGFNVAVYPSVEKLGKQIKYADRIGAKYVVILGPEEITSDRVSVKDLSSGEQVSVSLQDFFKRLHQMLAGEDSP